MTLPSARLRRFIRLAAAIGTLAVPGLSQGYIECNVTVQRYYVGGDILWAIWKEGGAGIITGIWR